MSPPYCVLQIKFRPLMSHKLSVFVYTTSVEQCERGDHLPPPSHHSPPTHINLLLVHTFGTSSPEVTVRKYLHNTVQTRNLPIDIDLIHLTHQLQPKAT